MNKLLEPPPGIVETVVRYECPRCGTSCECGVPYGAKVVRASEYAQQNPSASVREIAKEAKVSLGTAYNAKSGVQSERCDTTTGRDGKTYPAAKPRGTSASPTIAQAPDIAAKMILDLYLKLAFAERSYVRDQMDRIDDEDNDGAEGS